MADMSTVLERIKQAAAQKKMSLQAVSVQAGMSKDGIRNWQRKVKAGESFSAQHDNLVSVAKVLDVSLAWLEGDQSEGDPDFEALRSLWNQLKPEERDFLRTVAEARIGERGQPQKQSGSNGE